MKSRKFNWFDIALVIVLLALIAGTVVKFFVLGNNETVGTTAFSYTLEIKGVRNYTVDALHVGDAVYDNAGKAQVGTITAIDVNPAETVIAKPDGTIAKGSIEDRFDVTLTIAADGTVTDGSYEVGTYDICVNHSDTYYTKYSIWSAYIGSIG